MNQKIYETLFPESENQNVYNAEEYKNIIVDNSIFTIDKKEEFTSVLIGNKKFELYPSGNVKIQQHVQETMELLLTENLVPYEELQRLLTDKNYCYETFGINWNGFRYTLLKKDRNSDTVRYWAKKIWRILYLFSMVSELLFKICTVADKVIKNGK